MPCTQAAHALRKCLLSRGACDLWYSLFTVHRNGAVIDLRLDCIGVANSTMVSREMPLFSEIGRLYIVHCGLTVTGNAVCSCVCVSACVYAHLLTVSHTHTCVLYACSLYTTEMQIRPRGSIAFVSIASVYRRRTCTVTRTAASAAAGMLSASFSICMSRRIATS